MFSSLWCPHLTACTTVALRDSVGQCDDSGPSLLLLGRKYGSCRDGAGKPRAGVAKSGIACLHIGQEIHILQLTFDTIHIMPKTKEKCAKIFEPYCRTRPSFERQQSFLTSCGGNRLSIQISPPKKHTKMQSFIFTVNLLKTWPNMIVRIIDLRISAARLRFQTH